MKVAVLLLCLMTMSHSIANVYLEPYIGVGYGSYNANEGKGEYKATLMGTVYGTRVGLSSDELAVGFEFSQAYYGTSLASSPAGATTAEKAVFDNQDLDQTYYGIFASYRLRNIFEYLAKAWGTYYFRANSKGIEDESKDELNGAAVGVAIRPILFKDDFIDLHINIEYRTLNADRHHTTSEYILSISVPFDV